MLTSTKQVEIAKRSVDAAFLYTQAAINAAYETNSRVIAIWSQVAHTVIHRPEPADETWEWSGAPKRPHSTLLAAEQVKPQPPLDTFAVWVDLIQANRQNWFKGAPSPFAWWAWSPQSPMPATWPWAYGMIASGIPSSVAWPMAQANVALIDAAKKTAEVATPVTFPSYQSAGGFASAQVWMGSPLVRSMVAVGPVTAMFWPWIERAT